MTAHRHPNRDPQVIAEWSGVRYAVGQAKLCVARCVLALRRGDRNAAEKLAVDAQIALAAAEIGAADLERSERGAAK
jgi:hypothetical protein